MSLAVTIVTIVSPQPPAPQLAAPRALPRPPRPLSCALARTVPLTPSQPLVPPGPRSCWLSPWPFLQDFTRVPEGCHCSGCSAGALGQCVPFRGSPDQHGPIAVCANLLCELSGGFLLPPCHGCWRGSRAGVPVPGFLCWGSCAGVPMPGFSCRGSRARVPVLGFPCQGFCARIPVPRFPCRGSSPAARGACRCGTGREQPVCWQRGGAGLQDGLCLAALLTTPQTKGW